ncbi:MAG: ribonuclease P protein component [Candidatus Abyssobacteria bacterium SURF_17]|uniref:Ribonuclease P protein component n=1 Tax=Candidatus Abyssobacteria bacterium SURF_17 TaxID=2093361 RepID=A0A419F8B5_9BACT|nr:MAG: ribonuclease P protein component [Candidatus Abyssubacteria bacterium SURF_17]
MKNLGFPRGKRLKKQHEFKRIYRTGRKTADEYLTMYSRPAEGRAGKVGIVASKRVGKAVERNRIRRVLRETIRANQHRFSEKTDIVIIVKQPALELTHVELAEMLLLLLRKSGAN